MGGSSPSSCESYSSCERPSLLRSAEGVAVGLAWRVPVRDSASSSAGVRVVSVAMEQWM